MNRKALLIIAYQFVLWGIVSSCSCSHSDDYSSSYGVDEEIEEKWIECEYCDGNGYFINQCSDCNGSGNIKVNGYSQSETRTCRACAGTGIRPCSTCDNTGIVVCRSCKGERHYTCPQCHGAGVIEGCYYCQNKGLIFCVTCDGKGSVICSSCNGRGTLACNVCGGSGGPSYSYEQSQYADCNSCNGSGRVRVECPKCEGKGKVLDE